MYITVDIGATYIRIAGSKSLDKIVLVKKNIFSSPSDFKQGMTVLIDNIKKITSTPKAIGIGLAGELNQNKSRLVGSGNMKAWVDKPIRKILQDEFTCPIYIRNDAVVQSLAEAVYGQNKNFLYLTWGTGLGGAIVTEKKDIIALKISRKYLDKWEARIGGKNIEQRFKKMAKDLDDGEWDILLADLRNAILELSSELKMNNFILSGGIVDKQKDRILEMLRKMEKQKVTVSKFAGEIGLYGSLALIKTNFIKKSH